MLFMKYSDIYGFPLIHLYLLLVLLPYFYSPAGYLKRNRPHTFKGIFIFSLRPVRYNSKTNQGSADGNYISHIGTNSLLKVENDEASYETQRPKPKAYDA